MLTALLGLVVLLAGPAEAQLCRWFGTCAPSCPSCPTQGELDQCRLERDQCRSDLATCQQQRTACEQDRQALRQRIDDLEAENAQLRDRIAQLETAEQFACDYYASPAGGGSGLTEGSPFQIADYWPLALADQTLCLLPGRYVGDRSMIQPPQGLGGVTIRALTPGTVQIDGEGQRTAIELRGNDVRIIGVQQCQGQACAAWTRERVP